MAAGSAERRLQHGVQAIETGGERHLDAPLTILANPSRQLSE